MKRCGKQHVFFGIFNYIEVPGGGASLPCATGIAPRNASIGHFADLCKLHWVTLNVVSLNSVKYFIL